MKISEKGVKLIESFESYITEQPDGSCVAYLCPAGVPTIGYGCTEGVKLGMRWTRGEAEARFAEELVKHEAAVNRLATVALNQNQFDALVSFSYNCGAAALERSTILRKLNASDYDGAARAFALWNKCNGQVLRGLTRRRAAEAALFLEPMVAEHMPQRVDVPAPVADSVAKSKTIANAVVAGTAIAGSYADQTVSVAMESAAEWARLEPVRALLPPAKTIFLVIGGAAVLAVIWRRIKAQAEGKIG